MKRAVWIGLMVVLIAVLWLSGRRPAPPPYPPENYERALAETHAECLLLRAAGAEREQAAIQAFIDLFKIFSVEHLRGEVRKLYTDDAYFRDPFIELVGAEAIEAYLIKGAEASTECSFDMQDVGYSDGNYYFRWTMRLRLNRYADQPADISIGVTHVRFNRDGKVIFHQDYWDAANLYEKLPVLGGLIRWVKKQVH